MKFIIKETGETRELSAIDPVSGCEWTEDLMSDEKDMTYARDIGGAYIGRESFDFWTKYITDMNVDEDIRQELGEIYGHRKVDEIIAEEVEYADYEWHHDCRTRAFERIREELKPLAAEETRWEVYPK